jgi:hypothetical protein
MTCKIIFSAPFYRAYGVHPLCLLGCLHRRAIKWEVTPTQPTSSHRELSFFPFLSHGEVELACVGGHPGAPAKPHE